MTGVLASMRGRLERRRWQPNPDLYAPARYRRSCTYETFIPDPLLPVGIDLSGALAGVVSDAEAAIGALNTDARPALLPLARLLLRTEAIASSKVEGMQMDVRSLARAEARHDLGISVGREAAEILANVDAMQLAVEEASTLDRLSSTHIVAIHRALLRGTPQSAAAGAIRDEQNWIGGNDYNPCGADFVPPPSEEVARLLTDLCEFCDDESLPPLVQASIAHAQFETIHPFNDGNGRTGRALVQILLRRRGLAPAYVPPISVVLAGEKDAYIRGLEQFRKGEVHTWIEQFAVAAARAAQAARRYLGDVRALQEHWRDRLRALPSPPRADAVAWGLIDVLPAHPIITGPVGVSATGRSKPAVNLGIDQLVLAGVLSPLSQSTRNRSWEALGLLDVLADLEGGR
jgi:Fic family protein